MSDFEWRKVTGKDECCNCGKTGAEHSLLGSVFYCPGVLEYFPVDGRCTNCGGYESQHTRLGYKDLACRIPHNAKIVGEFLDLPEIDSNRLTAGEVKELNERFLEAAKTARHLPDALKHQEGGDHYKDLKIQPVEYIFANNIPFCEGNAIKYLTRWRSKGGVEDLKKAKHFIDLLTELEEKNERT